MSATHTRGYVITGVSRGLGHAIAAQALAEGATVVGIARRQPEGLEDRAQGRFQFIPLDLTDMGAVMADLDRLWQPFQGRTWKGLYLVNNAASSRPLGRADLNEATEVVQAMQVNLVAAMLLTNSFIDRTRGLAADRRVLNISSGAGRTPYPYMSVYCASKSGLDSYTQCVGLEQAKEEGGVRLASLAPGIIDTEMQLVSRSTPAEIFPMRQHFADYHDKGELVSPQLAAERVLRCLHSDRLGFGDLLHIRDFS
jgi:NAD(P)-dependent dehydrogenase (short-subunit alcohol dehydrogenase family)